MTSTLIVLVVIAGLVFWGISIYNGLVTMRQRVGQAFADIDVQLKQRHDLIPNLVETVKGYATHERETLDAVVKARNAAISAQGPAAQAPGRKRAERRAAPALRAVGGLSGPEGQHQFPAIADRDCRYRKQDRRRPPLLQQRGAGIQYGHRKLSRPCWSPIRSASHKREFFDLGESRPQLEQAPQVKF